MTNIRRWQSKTFFPLTDNEYKEAESQFKLAHNPVFRADVINNIGFLLFKLSRYKEAHKYLDEARRLTVRFKDKTHTAQIDESRAQLLIAARRLVEAERIARRAVSAFRKGGHLCLMAEALITQGVALARLDRTARAQFIFRQAIEVAHQVHVMNIAGLAALALIEEVPDLPPAILHAASLLEMRYQSLAYIIERRRPDLLKKRTPIRRRQRQKRK